ncbi:MAG: substrate-binding domain-containing protein [Mucilaginibacter sp.]
MKNVNVRIKDIALKAGVSTGTVDRVIHNRGRVDPEVEQRVQKILKEMNYQPNMIARALGSNKEYRIAALIPDPGFDSYWLGPKEGIKKAEAQLRQYGVRIQKFEFNPYMVGSYIYRAREVSLSNPDGIFLAPIFYRDTIPFFQEWQEKKIPFVLFNTQINESGALSYVGQDSYQSGLLAAKLVHYGQPQPCSIMILHIDEEISNAAHLVKKEQGFRDYFKQNGLDYYHISCFELNRPDRPGFAEKLFNMINSKPNLQSIYVTTSKSYEIAACLEQANVTHIKIVGYDLLPKNIEYLNKGAISFLINQNPTGQGYLGINQLANHLVFKKEVPLLKYLPLDVVTKENAEYFINDELVYDDHKLII